MTDRSATITLALPGPAATDRLGAWLAKALRPGDTLLLDGPIGAGKTQLSRALIRARLGRMEDVPSPTFTLVQVYEAADADIWHADLYRLSHPDEVAELGLEAAFATAICLIEWPDQLGSAAPQDAIHLKIEMAGEGRRATLSCTVRHRDLLARLSRDWAVESVADPA